MPSLSPDLTNPLKPMSASNLIEQVFGILDSMETSCKIRYCYEMIVNMHLRLMARAIYRSNFGRALITADWEKTTSGTFIHLAKDGDSLDL